MSLDGQTYAIPDGLVVQNNNRGHGFVRVPAAAPVGGELTVSVRRVGQRRPDDSKQITVVSLRGDLPDPEDNGLPGDFIADWNVLNRATLFRDIGKTTIAEYMDPVRVLADGLGDASNDLAVSRTRTDPLAAPMLDLRKRSYSNNIEDLTLERPYLAIGYTVASDGAPQKLWATNAKAAKALSGDATFVFAVDVPATGSGAGWLFQLGHDKPRWDFDTQYFGLVAPGGARSAKMIRNESANVATGGQPGGTTLATIDYIVAVWVEVPSRVVWKWPERVSPAW